MAIRANAGTVTLTLTNDNREGANPPVRFQGLNESPVLGQAVPFAFSIFVKATANIPASVLTFNGPEGSFVDINLTDGYWGINARHTVLAYSNRPIIPVTYGVWTEIMVHANEDNNYVVYAGTESGNGTIALTQLVNTHFPFYSVPFGNIQVKVHNHISVCNFKYWIAPFLSITPDDADRWDTDGPTPPMWSSTLRTPGDISSIANPYTSTNWAAGHGFSSIDYPQNLIFDATDPFFLANNRTCPTWVYPVIPTAQVVSPVGAGIQKGTTFFQFHDRGSVPLTLPAQLIKYYGLPQGSQTDTYGLYKDSGGIEVATPGERFEVNTGISLPVAVQPSNMYDWVYSAQFNNPTGGGTLSFLYLFVKYTGYPTGVGIPHVPGVPPVVVPPPVDPPPPVIPPAPGVPPIPPPQPNPVAMSGLFVINKGGLNIDNYDPNIRLKIPDPTIRTAFIGE